MKKAYKNRCEVILKLNAIYGVFDAISNKVPNANIHNLIKKFRLRFKISLSDVPKRVTVEAMIRELGAISDIQTAEALLVNSHCTLGFDATTQE